MNGLELTSEGWLIRIGDKALRCVGDVLSSQFDQWLAEQLEITPIEAWKLKNQLVESWRPENLEEWRLLFPKIVGEDSNVILALLGLFSLKIISPDERIMGIVIESSNSSGKSHFSKELLRPLMDQVLEFTRLTGPYLERLGMENGGLEKRIIYVQEASNAPYQLHVSLSEGKLRLGYVERQNGEFRPVTVETTGHPFAWIISANWSGNADIIHRVLWITLDESSEQTTRIVKHLARLNSDLKTKESFEAFSRGCMKLFRRLWDQIPENVEVVIPFAGLIAEYFTTNGLCENVKLRRDFSKLLTLVKSSAIMNYWKRPKIEREDKTILLATFDDFLEVLRIMESSLKPTLMNLTEKEVRVIEALKELGRPARYSELAKMARLPYSTIYHRVIPRLEALNLVTVDRDSTRMHLIELARQPPSLKLEDFEALRGEAEKLINQKLEELHISVSACECKRSEISPETGSDNEKKPESFACKENAEDLSLFSGESRDLEPSEKTPESLAFRLHAEGSGSFGGKNRDPGSFSSFCICKNESNNIWKPGEGPCENCGREVSVLKIWHLYSGPHISHFF
ncbi:MAG: hypothetical protein QXG35_06805 [Nitrososphaerota archaeon]